MFPIRDSIPSRSYPYVSYGLIAANVLVFFGQLRAGPEIDRVIERYGMVPARITSPERPIVVERREIRRTFLGAVPRVVRHEYADPPFHPWLTMLTCIFLHGGWLHLIGNCWFLYIFGDNVEDRLGHALFGLFYVVSGVGASFVHWASDPNAVVPTIGASGAIAGVMGAYFLLYPHARVVTVLPIFFLLEIMVVPAYVFLGVWFVLQFLQGSLAVSSHMQGGVAWWAHIGGFLVGGGTLLLLKYGGLLRSPPAVHRWVRPVTVYRYRFR